MSILKKMIVVACAACFSASAMAYNGNRGAEHVEAMRLHNKIMHENRTERFPSNVIVKMRRQGTKITPTPGTLVLVRYEGRVVDKKPFINTFSENAPVRFQFDQLSSCFQESLTLMGRGGKAIVYCPPGTYKGIELAHPLEPSDSKVQYILELLDVI